MRKLWRERLFYFAVLNHGQFDVLIGVGSLATGAIFPARGPWDWLTMQRR